MRKMLFISGLVILSFLAQGQPQLAAIDSIKKGIAIATTIEEKFQLTGQLSRVLMNVNPAEADKYGLELIRMGEESRKRELMIKAQLVNGERFSYLAGKKENVDKAIQYYTNGLEMAKQNKLDELAVSAYLLLSEIHRFTLDPDKALNNCNQAYSYTGTLKNDSLTAKVHLEYGMVYLIRNEKLLALRNMMAGLRIAEDLDNPYLLRSGYTHLSSFYGGIEDYDKSIDYQVKAQDILARIKSGQTPYSRVQDLNRIGDLYSAKKNYEMSRHYYEKSLALADSLNFAPIKAIGYRGIVNNYMASDQPQKALDYFNEHPQLKSFLETLGFGHFVNQSYGFIYTMIGKYDSAKYYYDKVASFFENDVNTGNQYSYYYQLGILHKKTGELDKSINYFLKANTIADKTGSLEIMKTTAEMLDTLYQLKGDYKQAVYYGSLNYKYKDSLAKLGKEKDLMQVEAADEQQRQERLAKEKEEKKKKRDSIQYLAITIGIAALFILLVMMGMFKVSVTTIKAIGFFVFLMFFEFIFLLFKKNIYAFTKGEPWKDLLFMIGLAAVLLPLHHWMEHRVIKYLTSHNRLTKAGEHLKTRFLKRTKSSQE